MEISPFPFSDDCSAFFSLVQDFTPPEMASPPKRPRTALLEDDDSSFQELMNKLLAFDNPPELKTTANSNPPPPPPPPSISPESNSNRISTDFGDIDYLDFTAGYPNLIDSSISPKLKRPRSNSDFAGAVSDDSGNLPPRRLWVKSRSNAWWEQINSPNFPDADFRRAFRMSRATFDMICNELESVITKKDTMLRTAIPVRQRAAVCIWRLATGEALREVSKRFGLGISTCHKLVLEVCSAICTVLMPKFLRWPDAARTAAIKNAFEASSGIPDVAGAIYTTHIPIIAPKINVAVYYNKWHTDRNQKTSYSVTLQGVVDPSGVFTDICIGWPGSMSDDRVLENSALYSRANRGALINSWIVGGSSYPLTDWVLAPYPSGQLTWAQHAFNEKVEGARMAAKGAFSRLKARWSCLQKRTEMKLKDLPVVLAACCVLHNVCESRGEALSPDLKFEVFDDEVAPEENVKSVTAMHARDEIARKVLHHEFVGTNYL
ncbi:protein ANTAGONIST OF LIKE HETEROCHROMATIN PROTEIN 1-like [Andrographis paniculata]|uniref:protein ANTAGONIST OF LIKE HETEROCHROMATIN PROTEIN 1-like n=1 Tax=Andrographis paniculata TaxID=175694 RepID=UPI0021E89C81|nr:protein ANTAGONIST OF LIKE HETEROCHROMATIN PROTEIN 1-like [Andrographis paniculata]